MPKLSFSDQLNDSQREYAREIGIKAEEMGIPAELAISIAYQESRLNPNAPRGAKGEFGGLQVMPATGKIMGYTNKDLADPKKNMEAGLKYLKQNLDAFSGDPKLATIGYNAGTDSSFFSGGKLPESTERYLKDVDSYGAFEATGAATPAAPAEAPSEPEDMVPALAPPPPPPKLDLSGASRGEKFLGGALGAGVGTFAAGAESISDVMTGRAATRAGAEETARIAAQRAAGASAVPGATPTAIVAPSGAPAGASGAQPIRQPAAPAGGNLQPPMGPADAGRMARGQTGAGTYNYAKNLGLTDIEAGRALDTTKQEGGAHSLLTERREGLNKVRNLPGEQYVENPRYGGFLTTDQSVGRGPRESFSMKPAVPPSPDLPLGEPGGLSKLPPRQPVSTAPMLPKGPSGLDAVTNTFKGMMRPVASAAKVIGKYALPPLAGLSAGLDVADIAHEYDKPDASRDYTKMGLKAASAIGGALSMYPPAAVVGVPLSLGASGIQAYRDNPEWLGQKMNSLGRSLYPNMGQPKSDQYFDPMTGLPQ